MDTSVVAAALTLDAEFILRCVSNKQHAELFLEVTTLAQELQHLVDSYAATAAQAATLRTAWAHTHACTHAQPLLNAVLPLLAQAQDACSSMERRVVTRLRAVEAALRALMPRLEFVAEVNRETATELAAGLPVAAAQRLAVASVASVLARRLKVLCVDGGDTSGMSPSLAAHARSELQAQLQALGCPAGESDGLTMPPPSSSDPPGTVLTPHAARARAQAEAAAAAHVAAAAVKHGGGAGVMDVGAIRDNADDALAVGGAARKRPVGSGTGVVEEDPKRQRCADGDDGGHDNAVKPPPPPPPPVAPLNAMHFAPPAVGAGFDHPAARLDLHGAAAPMQHSQRSILGSVSPGGGGGEGAPPGEGAGVGPDGAQPRLQGGVTATPVAGLLAAQPNSGGHSSPGVGSGAGAAGAPAGGLPLADGPRGVPGADVLNGTDVGRTPYLFSLVPPTTAGPGPTPGGGPISGSPSTLPLGQRVLTYSSADPVPPAAAGPQLIDLDFDERLFGGFGAAAMPASHGDAVADVPHHRDCRMNPSPEGPVAAHAEHTAVEENGQHIVEQTAGAAGGESDLFEDEDGHKEDTPPGGTQLVGGGGTQLLQGTSSSGGRGGDTLARCSQSLEVPVA